MRVLVSLKISSKIVWIDMSSSMTKKVVSDMN
jgi:hypothetical protein